MDKKTGSLDDAKLEQVSGGASQEGIEESTRSISINGVQLLYKVDLPDLSDLPDLPDPDISPHVVELD